jgi:hypothetical protein
VYGTRKHNVSDTVNLKSVISDNTIFPLLKNENTLTINCYKSCTHHFEILVTLTTAIRVKTRCGAIRIVIICVG